MVTLGKEVRETLEGATQPGTQFQGTEIEERTRTDHKTGIVNQLLPGHGGIAVVWHGGLYPTKKSHLNLKRKISRKPHFNTRFSIEKTHRARHNFSVTAALSYHIYFYCILVLFYAILIVFWGFGY